MSKRRLKIRQLLLLAALRLLAVNYQNWISSGESGICHNSTRLARLSLPWADYL